MCKVYDVINSRLLELLEQGTVPWRKTWNAASNQPKNLVSKKEYRGINVFLLDIMSASCKKKDSPLANVGYAAGINPTAQSHNQGGES